MGFHIVSSDKTNFHSSNLSFRARKTLKTSVFKVFLVLRIFGGRSAILKLAMQSRIAYNGSVRKRKEKRMQKGLFDLWIVQN